jgi:hypothetical protein
VAIITNIIMVGNDGQYNCEACIRNLCLSCDNGFLSSDINDFKLSVLSLLILLPISIFILSQLRIIENLTD